MLRIRKDKKKCVQYFFSVLFVLFAFCFTSFIINQENSVYAVSDISVTYDSDVSSWQNVFPTCDGDCLNNYQYLIVEIAQPYYGYNSSLGFYLRYDGSQMVGFTISTSTSYAIYQLPFNGSSNNHFSFRNGYSIPSNFGSITFTLTESYQSGAPSGSITLSENGTYDVTSYAEAVVDVPAEVVPGDYDDEFNGVIIAIYTCGAIVIMIYFFYIIYGIIIKPTGGSK